MIVTLLPQPSYQVDQVSSASVLIADDDSQPEPEPNPQPAPHDQIYLSVLVR